MRCVWYYVFVCLVGLVKSQCSTSGCSCTDVEQTSIVKAFGIYKLSLTDDTVGAKRLKCRSIPQTVNDVISQLVVTDTEITTLTDQLRKYSLLTQLTISGTGLTTVSSTAFNSFNHNLTLLDLSNNEITSMNFLAGLSSLNLLDLSANKITSINITNHAQLQFLNLSSNSITSLSGLSLSTYSPELGYLNLARNQIEELSPGVFIETLGILYLDLSHNMLTNLTHNIRFSQLINVTYIDLSYNLLEHVESDALMIPSLKVLILSHNQLATFLYSSDHTILDTSYAIQLQILLLNNNNITELSDDMCTSLKSLSVLRTLSLAHNYIADIPNFCFENTILESLYLDNNHITTTGPHSFSGILQLTHLSIHGNHDDLKLDMSGNRVSFQKIKQLDIRYSHIMEITEFSFEAFENLEYLDLSHNELEDLHSLETHHKLKKLKYIDFSNNRLSAFDHEQISDHFTNVEVLLVSHNEIEKFNVSSLIDTPKLVTLDLSHNFINTFTARYVLEIESNFLNRLRYLNLTRNFLESLDYMQNIKFPSLEVINLRSNHFISLPACMFARSHISENLTSLDYSNNSIRCDCSTAWLRELDNLVSMTVIHSRCAHGNDRYQSDNYPITRCTTADVFFLRLSHCTSTNANPNFKVLIFFVSANLFLISVVFFEVIKDMYIKRKERSRLVTLDEADLIEKSTFGQKMTSKLDDIDLAFNTKYDDTHPQTRHTSREDFGPGSDHRNLRITASEGSVIHRKLLRARQQQDELKDELVANGLEETVKHPAAELPDKIGKKTPESAKTPKSVKSHSSQESKKKLRQKVRATLAQQRDKTRTPPTRITSI